MEIKVIFNSLYVWREVVFAETAERQDEIFQIISYNCVMWVFSELSPFRRLAAKSSLSQFIPMQQVNEIITDSFTL